jgi:glycerophosphoryl diester phosphodiesterase
LRRSGLLEKSFVSSPSLRTLAVFAALEPRLPRSFSYPEDRFALSGRRALAPVVRPGVAALRAVLTVRLPRLLRAAGAQAATLSSNVVTTGAIEACHAAGVAVYVWTVNDPALAKTLVESGADGIITDDPRLLRRRIRPTS